MNIRPWVKKGELGSSADYAIIIEDVIMEIGEGGNGNIKAGPNNDNGTCGMTNTRMTNNIGGEGLGE